MWKLLDTPSYINTSIPEFLPTGTHTEAVILEIKQYLVKISNRSVTRENLDKGVDIKRDWESITQKI